MKVLRNLAIVFTSVFYVLCINVYALAPTAKSAVLIEQSTGKILYEKNAYQKLPMASTTKIMTAICAIENGNLDEMVEVDKSAVGVEGSSMYLGYGEKLTLRNLIYGLMLSSGNDAAVAVAMHISGSIEDFAALMNETAKKIGVENTSFENPNGLDSENHYTTAYDLALITRYALENEEFAKIVGTYETTIPWDGKEYDRTLKNHNKLLKTYDGATGVKTGFTKKSGRCLVSSAERNGLKLVAVTLSDSNDWEDHKNMLDFGFDNYEMACVVKKGDYARSAAVEFSDVTSVPLEFKEDVYILSKKGENTDVSLVYEIPGSLTAPVGFGKNAGSVQILVNGNLNKKVDVITAGCATEKKVKSFSKELKNIITKYINGM